MTIEEQLNKQINELKQMITEERINKLIDKKLNKYKHELFLKFSNE